MGRNIGAGVAGVIIAFALVWIVEAIGHMIYPPPADLDFGNTDVMRAYVDTLPLGALLSVAIAWFVGAFGGPAVLNGKSPFALVLSRPVPSSTRSSRARIASDPYTLDASMAAVMAFSCSRTPAATSYAERLKAMDKPHDIDEPTNRRRRWSGTVFTIGGAYTVFMLLYGVEFPYVVAALSQYAEPVIVELLVVSLRWFLFLGGVFAFVVGVMMLVSPSAIPTLGARLNRWYSTEKLAEGANQMHMTLDSLAETYPRTTGLALAFLSTFALIAAMIVWVGR